MDWRPLILFATLFTSGCVFPPQLVGEHSELTLHSVSERDYWRAETVVAMAESSTLTLHGSYKAPDWKYLQVEGRAWLDPTPVIRMHGETHQYRVTFDLAESSDSSVVQSVIEDSVHDIKITKAALLKLSAIKTGKAEIRIRGKTHYIGDRGKSDGTFSEVISVEVKEPLSRSLKSAESLCTQAYLFSNGTDLEVDSAHPGVPFVVTTELGSASPTFSCIVNADGTFFPKNLYLGRSSTECNRICSVRKEKAGVFVGCEKASEELFVPAKEFTCPPDLVFSGIHLKRNRK